MHDQPDLTVEKSAAATLDQIRGGGAQLVSVAMERLDEVRVALQEGRFVDAADRGNEMMGRISALSQAEQFLGTFEEAFVVRASDVQEGMELRSWGRVTGIEREEIACAGGEPHVHVTLTLDGDEEPKKVNGEQELIALRAAPEI